jgi:hypothetical protein
MTRTLVAALATVFLSLSFTGCTFVTVDPALAQGSDVLVQAGLRLPRSHQYELYDRVNQSYTHVRVETVPSYLQQGAWIHDRTAGLWVSHPSVGEPNPQYAASGRDFGRGASVSDRDVLVQAGLRLPRSHRYELYDRGNQSYTHVRVETVPSYVQQGAWIHDRTAGLWVSHPSVGEPSPDYAASGRAGRGRASVSDRDVLVQAGLRLPRSHRYELYDRVNESYTPVRVETVPSYVQQGAWIHDRTAGLWVSHPSVGEPSPDYAVYGR